MNQPSPIRHPHPITGEPISPMKTVWMRARAMGAALTAWEHSPAMRAHPGPWLLHEVYLDPAHDTAATDLAAWETEAQVLLDGGWVDGYLHQEFATFEAALTHLVEHPGKCPDCLTRLFVIVQGNPV